MNFLKLKLMKITKFLFLHVVIFLLLTSNVFSKEILVNGNNFSDDNVIISIIGQIPDSDNKTQSNFILKQLNKSGLFKSVEISEDDKNFLISVVEYPSVSKIYFNNNKRLKNDQLNLIAEELEVTIFSDKIINKFIDEIVKVYQAFGYNNIKIDYETTDLTNNSVNIYLNIDEGKITKIKSINFKGNTNYDNSILYSKIKSKIKNISNIFANNNFKLFQVNNDSIKIKNFYKSKGYKNSEVSYNIEYFNDNKVIINFEIDEGNKFYVSSVNINNLLNKNTKVEFDLKEIIDSISLDKSIVYNNEFLDDVEFSIVNILEKNGIQFFEVQTLEKINENNNLDILFNIIETKPVYINQINIFGNTRTFDYVIRRELDIIEGDSLNNSKIKKTKKQINQLSIFSDVEVETSETNSDLQDLNIKVSETQTGSFNVGLSLGTLDGVSFLSGLKEKNINGTGRSLEFLINTSQNNKAFTLSTSEKFILNNKINHRYSANYKENNYAKSKSYKLNTLILDTDLTYKISDDFFHTFGVGYHLKDYTVTNSSTVSDSIANSAGESISFNIKNEFSYNTLNSFIKPSDGNFVNFSNYIQTPSSSSNGYIKNVITSKKYIKSNNNIFSVQSRLGNIFSLNDHEILSDDKFSLGGRWLRGFDNFGAGPRNSRNAYVGGNNLAAIKLDFSKPLTLNDLNPIYLNLFNDYGLVWENKNTVTSTDNSIRSSYGFGINYYSPIGPIGFSWGFPIADKEYDIKRMFMFTIGNLN